MNNLKLAFYFLLPLILIGWKPKARSSESPQIFAVIVGVANYKDDKIPNLKFPEKDAIEFYNVLRSPICGSIPEDNIVLLVGLRATRANVMKAVIDKYSRAHENDMIIFYFSGHGVGGEFENDGYLLSYDTDIDNESITALSMDEIRAKVDRSQAKMKVSYVDACHAGLFKSLGKGSAADDNAAIASAVKEGLNSAGEGNVSFLASTARQQSLEDDKLGHGLFTYYLINGLKGAADSFNKQSDGYNNGIVTISELSDYLTAKIGRESKFKQRPSVDGLFDDQFPLSVVSPNVSMLKAISTRPLKKAKIENKNYATESGITASVAAPTYDLADKPFPPDQDDAGGYFNFINTFKEPIMIYSIDPVYVDRLNILIAPGQKGKSPRLHTGFYYKDSRKISSFYSPYHVCFQTIDESKPIKYGEIIVTPESFIEKTMIVSENNLYLSEHNKKR